MKANKGEWSEFYAFLKILCDKKLPAADKNLETIEDRFFIFHKIFRKEQNGAKVYDLQGPDIVILNDLGEVLKILRSDDVKVKTLKILERIKEAKTGTFEISEAQEMLQATMSKQIKAGSAEKADLSAVVYDRISSQKETLGFSVKSMLGGASTLLNAGKTTNFVFKVTGLNSDQMQAVNAIGANVKVFPKKIQKRFEKIIDLGGQLYFEKVLNDAFFSNLKMVDTVFHVFVAQMLIDFVSGKGIKTTDLVDLLSKNEKLIKKYGLTKSVFEFKFKNLLIASALGMVPGKEWDGFTKAHGGYIVVKPSGEVVCYHLYNREEFLTYLYENTKFDSASSTRHDYGHLYMKDSEMYFNLNLQIRFLK